ncbi:MAG: hypothetical protein H0U52_13320 [Chloroflexi bacterium]|nr:hypothetical protein [Chloroflexota bacterium]
MPQLGESVAEGTIGKWLKHPGDAVESTATRCRGRTSLRPRRSGRALAASASRPSSSRRWGSTRAPSTPPSSKASRTTGPASGATSSRTPAI